MNSINKKYIYTKYSIVNDDGVFYKLDEVNIY
jgi:hypothetical protein